jgi:hypothetical protein
MRKLCLWALATYLLSGCAAAGLSVAGASAGVAVGTGVEHTLTGITYKTFTASADDLHWAARKALGRMEMTVIAEQATQQGWTISATATEREIEVELEHLTPNTTRMRVVANKGNLFFKDAATATEIVLQTADMLDEMRAAEQAPALKPKPKPRKRT